MGMLFAVPAFADISVGYLSLLADNPTGGEQNLTISNVTGSADCDAVEYLSCTNLNFTNWTLTVNYTSDYYNFSGPNVPSPLVFTDGGSGSYGGFGDITAGNSLSFPIDLCAGAGSCANPNNPDTQITSVEFSGQISPSAFCLYDIAASGCNLTNPTTFFANPNFDLIWTGAPGVGPYVDEDSEFLYAGAQSPDITVATQSNTVVTPEPGGFVLVTALLPFALFLRRKLVRRS
jgi:hypothetical protein